MFGGVAEWLHNRIMSLILIAALSASLETTPVAVHTGGDDGLTQRLAEAVREEFRRTPGYRLDHTSTRMTVTIPTHVDWRRILGRTRVSYVADFRSGDRESHMRGSCWEGRLSACARSIVRQADRLEGLGRP